MVYCLQQFYFQDEIATLTKKLELPSASKYKALNLFIESKYGLPLLRVGGRLAHSELPYDSKHQILLPNNSDAVRSFVRYLHIK